MAEYYIGQKFVDNYPREAVDWCNQNDAYIHTLGRVGGVDNFEIRAIEPDVIDVDTLTMTALDFVNFLKQAGLTDIEIELYLNNNLSVKHQLQFCQNVYCGVAKSLMPITFDGITITADMVEYAFKLKNGVI